MTTPLTASERVAAKLKDMGKDVTTIPGSTINNSMSKHSYLMFGLVGYIGIMFVLSCFLLRYTQKAADSTKSDSKRLAASKKAKNISNSLFVLLLIGLIAVCYLKYNKYSIKL